MSGPNAFLSEHYGTAVVPTTDDVAQAFVKIAAEDGIDLNSMTDEQVIDAYAKVAQAAEEGGAGSGDEIEQASAELADAIASEAQQQAAPAAAPATKEAEAQFQDDWARADFCGRVIAHAQFDETRKLAEAYEGAGDDDLEELMDKVAEAEAYGLLEKLGMSPGFPAKPAFGGKEPPTRGPAATPKGGRVPAYKLRTKADKRVSEWFGQKGLKRWLTKGGVRAKAFMAKHPAASAAIIGGTALAGAGGAYAAGKSQRKAASAETDDTFIQAVINRMNEKIAAAQEETSQEDAIEEMANRTLEKLSERGYFG